MRFFSDLEGDIRPVNQMRFENFKSVDNLGFSVSDKREFKIVQAAPPELSGIEKAEFDSVDPGLDYSTIILANQERRSQMQQFKGMVIEVTVPGDSRRRVGDIVRTEFPAEPVVPNRQDDTIDLSISGKYMVTHIRHQIRKDDYKLVMELSRNSRAKRIPDINQGIEPETAPS